MSHDPESPAPGAEGLALDVFLDFLRHEAVEDDAAFERLCAGRGELAAELRRLRAHARQVDLGAGSALGVGPRASIEEQLRRLSSTFAAGARYQREGVLARGGMGVIHRVKDLQLERHLALKVMAAGSANEHTLAAARFLEEAQVTAQLDHPGIVPVHECGVDADGRPYFAMKLVHGRDLRQVFELVRAGAEGWTTTRALGVLLKVCEAVAYAHSKGVLHRDLKPGNVMVGHFGEVYVMDWGLARVMGRQDLRDLRLQPADQSASLHTSRREAREETPDSPLVTMDGAVVGTPAYMPPEQARGEVESLSGRSDVYSVGAILYHLLAGSMPYATGTARLSQHTILALVLHGAPTALEQSAPDAPAELVAICKKAMARDPEQRYPGMLAMAEDLRAFLEGRVVKAHARGPVAELGKWVRRNKAFAAASAAAILALVGGLVVSNRSQGQAAESARLLALESVRANEAAQAAQQYLEQVLRLSDLQELDELESEADKLWPVTEERVPHYEAWLERARRLLASLPEHRRTRSSLPSKGSSEELWWPNQLERLIAGIEELHDPKSGLVAGQSPKHGPGIQSRLDFAKSVRELTLDSPDASARWSAASASIRADPVYKGLVLAPQLGLLPIGQDPHSGLWEFAHLQSGEPAVRDPDGRLVLRPETGLVLVLLPRGSFWMGAQAQDPEGRHYSALARTVEGPVRQVRIGAFFLSKYEMTQAQWERISGSNPSTIPVASRLQPVESVSWNVSAEVSNRLGLRLPSESEWEYAARAGTDTIWWTGDELESLEGAANIADRLYAQEEVTYLHESWLDDGARRTTQVGSYAANGFGLHDVIGNVQEFCASTDLGDDGEGRPFVDESRAQNRILRGGSWQSVAAGATSTFRLHWKPTAVDYDTGLRPARDIDE